MDDVTAECEVTALVDPSATDNCGGTVTVTNDAIFPLPAQGTTVVTWTYEDENGNMLPLNSAQEEIGWFITEIIMEIEEEERIKVQEFVDIDTNHDFGLGLDAALNVDAIDDSVIRKFIKEFNDDTLKLDPTAFSFQTEEEDI